MYSPAEFSGIGTLACLLHGCGCLQATTFAKDSPSIGLGPGTIWEPVFPSYFPFSSSFPRAVVKEAEGVTPHSSPFLQAVPEAGFPKSILQRKQGEAPRNFKGTANFSPMQSCKIPSTSVRGFLREQKRRRTAALLGPGLFPSKASQDRWGKGADSRGFKDNLTVP